jgi:hypothetical protein
MMVLPHAVLEARAVSGAAVFEFSHCFPCVYRTALSPPMAHSWPSGKTLRYEGGDRG